MNTQTVDHSKEVETRLKAIRVSQEDSCQFFKYREGSIISVKECQYCKFGCFERDESNNITNPAGLCKYRK